MALVVLVLREDMMFLAGTSVRHQGGERVYPPNRRSPRVGSVLSVQPKRNSESGVVEKAFGRLGNAYSQVVGVVGWW
jgi:hypothetical protein